MTSEDFEKEIEGKGLYPTIVFRNGFNVTCVDYFELIQNDTLIILINQEGREYGGMNDDKLHFHDIVRVEKVSNEDLIKIWGNKKIVASELKTKANNAQTEVGELSQLLRDRGLTKVLGKKKS